HYLRSPSIKRRQFFQRLIQRKQVSAAFFPWNRCFIELHHNSAATTFLRAPLPRVMHHDSAHELRGYRKKMGAVLPRRTGLSGQLYVGVIKQRRGLQRMSGSFPTHVSVGQTVQLRLNQRDQFFQSALVSVPPIAKELRNLLLR